MSRQLLVFGPFALDPDKGTLLRQGEPVALGRRGGLLLDALLKRPGEILTKTELVVPVKICSSEAKPAWERLDRITTCRCGMSCAAAENWIAHWG